MVSGMLQLSHVGSLFTSDGRRLWAIVFKRYLLFFMICLGIWTDESYQAFEPLCQRHFERCVENLDVKNDDIVKVFNDRGSCLAGIKISDDVMEGIVFLPVGAWYNPAVDDDTFCVHGNPNVLTDDIGCSSLSQGPSAHSTLVQIHKWEKDLPSITIFDAPILKKLKI